MSRSFFYALSPVANHSSRHRYSYYALVRSHLYALSNPQAIIPSLKDNSDYPTLPNPASTASVILQIYTSSFSLSSLPLTP
jgi:hypothetical protein